MKSFIKDITTNIGARLKSFCVWFYLFECAAGIIGGIITFFWGIGDGSPLLGFAALMGGFLVPLVLYPVFMFFYGYGIIVHRMEKGDTADEADEAIPNSPEKPAAKLTHTMADATAKVQSTVRERVKAYSEKRPKSAKESKNRDTGWTIFYIVVIVAAVLILLGGVVHVLSWFDPGEILMVGNTARFL